MFCELSTTALIAVRGPDAVTFLQGQLTSDVAGLVVPRTQYSGYCSPQGRLLATFLLWRLPETLLLQLPATLLDPVQTRLKKYVLRAKVELADATAEYRLFGVSHDTAGGLRTLVPALPERTHDVSCEDGIFAARVAGERFLVLAAAAPAESVRSVLARAAADSGAETWARLDIAAGIPTITQATQEQFIPQMLNLDALGAVSYTKGCYPGQEIVARTRYLGRLKQRLYPVTIPSAEVAAGDQLYSAVFGPAQASGTIVNAGAERAGLSRALAVIQLAAAQSDLRWKTPDGPRAVVGPLPYPLPE